MPTPGVIAALDQVANQANIGKVMTFEEYDKTINPKREPWLREHPNFR